MRNRTTIVDVAREAGVSKSLVSLAIRNDPGVSAETRARILAVAEDLGYRSNLWARSLVQGSTGLVGVLLTDLSNDYHTDVVVGLEDAATEQGLGVLISHGRRDPGRLTAQLERLVQLRVDGIVVISAHTPHEAIERARRETPTVIVGRPARVPDGVGQVSNDDDLGGSLAVGHLLASGRTPVAFHQGSGSPSALARRDAYVRIMDEHGMQPRILEPGGFGIDDLARLDGVFASNDRGAAQVLGAALDGGLDVPGDLAVVGYDDTQLARFMRPQLSSIAQPRLTMGRRALEILQSGEAVREVHPPELVVRASSS